MIRARGMYNGFQSSLYIWWNPQVFIAWAHNPNALHSDRPSSVPSAVLEKEYVDWLIRYFALSRLCTFLRQSFVIC